MPERSAFALLFLLVLSQATIAQTSSSIPKIAIGVKAGGNLYDTYQAGTKYFVSSPHAGFHAGLYGDYALDFLSPKLAASLEALFSTRGLYLSEYVNGRRIDYERESSYIDLPVALNYGLWDRIRIHAGIVPSLFIEEYRSITKDSEGRKTGEGDQFRSYERWQFGAMAGVAYPFALFDRSFEAGARYSMGLTRTNELIRDVRASRDPKYMMVQVYIAFRVFEW